MANPTPTLEDVAREAGVSRSTASRAINGGLRVSPDAQAAVDAAVERLSYTPNRAARSLVTRRTDSIALVAPEPESGGLIEPFLPGLLRGMTDSIQGTNLQLVTLLNGSGDQASRIARYLAAGHVDGAVVATHHKHDYIDEALERAEIPVVYIGRPSTDKPRHYVDLDNYLGGVLAAQRLIDRGCKKIGTIAGPMHLSAGLDRLNGWADTLKAAGYSADAWTEGNFTGAGGRAAAERLMDAHPDLDGIFAASDIMAEGAMRVLRTRGLRVPADIAVVGFDNMGIADIVTPRLTTVHNPMIHVTGLATQALLAMIRGEKVSYTPQVVKPYLVDGETA